MFKTIVVLALVVLVAVGGNTSNSQCPHNCDCYGEVPSVCTRCTNPIKDIKTNCSTCISGFSKNAVNQCVPTCPSYCACRGLIPNVCTSCQDENSDLSTQCSTCLLGYHPTGQDGVCTEIPNNSESSANASSQNTPKPDPVQSASATTTTTAATTSQIVLQASSTLGPQNVPGTGLYTGLDQIYP